MVGSGGFEPPTSSASERRSPTELRACPKSTRHCTQGARGVSSQAPITATLYRARGQRRRFVSDDSTTYRNVALMGKPVRLMESGTGGNGDENLIALTA